MTQRHRDIRQSGSALISSLLAVVVLTIIVTAFLQSMTTERRTSRSYLNRERARLAAESGTAVIMSRLQGLFEEFPDSATSWSHFPDTEGTTFYYRSTQGSDGLEGATPPDTTADTFAIPLISGSSPVLADELSQVAVFANNLESDTSVEINAGNWIDSSSSASQMRAEWVEILENPTSPRDDTFNPDTRRATNGPIARYAFWVEDESFRLNVNVAGAEPRGGSSLGASPSEASIQAVTNDRVSNLKAEDIIAKRENMPQGRFNSPSEILYAGSTTSEDRPLVEKHITTVSSSLNLSRSGAKRVNLNRIISDSNDPAEIRPRLDRIIATISNPRAMPDFGQRFYQFGFGANGLNGSSVTEKHSAIYLQKIAANIRDYIDTDYQPTVVLNINGNPSDSSPFEVAETRPPRCIRVQRRSRPKRRKRCGGDR